MHHRVHVPVFAVGLLALFVAGFVLYSKLGISSPAYGPDEEALWPGTESWARDHLSQFSLEQKAAQLISVRISDHLLRHDDALRGTLLDLVDHLEIGGVTLDSGSSVEIAVLVDELQGRSRIPLLVGQDLEADGGLRVGDGTAFPHVAAFGAAGDAQLAHVAGLVTAREARALGIHQVIAPVPAFERGSDFMYVQAGPDGPRMAEDLAWEFIRGVSDGGVMMAARYAPGQSDVQDARAVRSDPHEVRPLRKLIERGLMSIATAPPATALVARLTPRPVVSGPSVIPGADGAARPQVDALAGETTAHESGLNEGRSHALSPEIVRSGLGFRGLIVGDLRAGGSDRAAVGAIGAGADMIVTSEHPRSVRDAIVAAMERGELSERRVDEALMRILRTKAWAGLPTRLDADAATRMLSDESHRVIGETVARRSLTLVRNEGLVVPIPETARVLVVAAGGGTSRTPVRRPAAMERHTATQPDAGGAQAADVFLSYLRRAHRSPVDAVFLDSGSQPSDYARVLEAVPSYDVVVLVRFALGEEAARSYREHTFLHDLIARADRAVLTTFGDPHVAAEMPVPDAHVVAYGASESTLRAAADALTGRSGFYGRLPAAVSGLYRVGEGIQLPARTIRQGLPAEVGMRGDLLGRVDSLIHASVRNRVFPGAAVAIGRNGVLTKLGAYGYHTYDNTTPVTTRSRYDVASLTKVVATTTAAMQLYEAGLLGLDDRVGDHLPEFGRNGKDGVTIRHLLTHTAGLIPYRQYHRMNMTTRHDVIHSIMEEPLVYRPGGQSRYSDLSMITLMLVIERITGQDFATYAREHIFEPLGMLDTGFVPTIEPDPTAVPTEVDRLFRRRLIQGEVHDETAWILGGVSGHAGLFSTAEDLAKFAYMLLNGGEANGRQFLEESTIRAFTRPQAPGRHTRALGWDMRNDNPSGAAGALFGPNSFGHNGFTGTSMWIDPDAGLFVILLSNRVYPSRNNPRISQVRARLADLAHGALISPPPVMLPVIDR